MLKTIKTAVPFTLALSLALAAGCGTGDDPVSPGSTPPLAAGTVDAAGGELAAAEIVLTVPAGALTAPTDLGIHIDAGSGPFAADTPVYRLTGLPETLDAPITLRVRHDVARAGDIAVFLGEERDSYDTGRGLTWFEVSARDSAGWNIVQLERGPYELDSAKADPELRVTTVPGLEHAPTSGGHFEIVYDPMRTTAGQVALIAAHLERAWNEVVSLGFGFGGSDIWPRPVYLRDITSPSGRLAEYTIAPWGKGHFTLDPDALVNSVAMGIITGHEVLHCAQDHHDPRHPSTWKTINPDRLWLDEATASWFEEKFYPGDDFYPMAMGDPIYTMAMDMFVKWRLASQAELGYAGSQLIKYVVETQGEGRILEFYEAFQESGEDATAFQDVVDPPMSSWIADFYHQLVTGSIYPYLEPGDLWFDLDAQSALVGGEIDEFRPPWPLYEMQAHASVFAVTDEREHPAPALKVTPAPGGPLQVMLYGLNEGRRPVLIAEAPDSLEVEGLPTLTGTYAKFLAMGVRIEPYVWRAGDKEWRDPSIALAEDDLARFETAEISMRYKAHYSSGYIESWQSMRIDAAIGRIGGHTYHAQWDSVTPGGDAVAGQITIDLDPETMDVTAFSAFSTTYDPGQGRRNNLAISGTAVPLRTEGSDAYEFGLEGAGTCGSVLEIRVETIVDDEVSNQVEYWECTDDSYLNIFLKDEIGSAGPVMPACGATAPDPRRPSSSPAR